MRSAGQGKGARRSWLTRFAVLVVLSFCGSASGLAQLLLRHPPKTEPTPHEAKPAAPKAEDKQRVDSQPRVPMLPEPKSPDTRSSDRGQAEPMPPSPSPKPTSSEHPKSFASAKTVIEPFEASPFPYQGKIPEQNIPFLDVDTGGRHGHRSPRGGVYWEDQAYRDKSVLLSIPPGIDFGKPVLIVLYMHGNQAKLGRDVRDRQHIPRQLAASGLNAVLVAPQFAVDALDSSAGRFWEPGFLKTFLTEAADHLATLSGDERAGEALKTAPVVIVAYSGGYLPTAFALQWGGAESRVHGVILLDALYAEEPRIAEWVKRRGPAFFFSAYSPSTRKPNETLQQILKSQGVPSRMGLPETLEANSVAFLATDNAVTHQDFLSRAWTPDPMTAVLSRVKGYDRAAAPTPKHETPDAPE